MQTGSIQRLFPQPVYLTNPSDLVANPFPLEGLYRGLSQVPPHLSLPLLHLPVQVAAELPASMVQEGEEEPAALAL